LRTSRSHTGDVNGDIDLLPGERLLWSGMPVRHPVFDRNDLLLVPVTLAWFGFAVFWETGVIREDWLLGELWGIPFLLIGLYLVAGRLVVRVLRHRSTRYVVTDRRVVEISTSPRPARTEAYLNQLAPPVLNTADGTVGSIAFGSFPSMIESAQELSGPRRRDRGPRRIVLREIGRPRRVRDLIAEAQQQMSGQGLGGQS